MEAKKRKYSKIKISDKLKIIKLLDSGESVSNLATEYGITRSAVLWLKKNRAKIVAYANLLDEGDGTRDKKVINYIESSALERAVLTWFLQRRSLGEPVSGPSICEKALTLNERLGGPKNFKASNGWLHKFKKRHGIIRELFIQGEKQSSDAEAADAFRDELSKLMEENDYSEEQIYNADETVLRWKALPRTTTAGGQEGNVTKDRVTVMVCANAGGTHRLPVLVIDKARNPRSFENVRNLPVVYKSQERGWMDCDIFTEWYSKVFVPVVKQRQIVTGKGGKVLLLLDNSPSHPSAESLNSVDEKCKVMFLPARVKARGMSQGIVERMKMMYRKNILREVLLRDDAESVKRFFEKLTLKDCCYVVANAWESVTEAEFRNAWRITRLGGDDAASNGKENPDVREVLELLHRIPGCGGCSEEGARSWLEKDRNDRGWEVLGDNDIVSLVTGSNCDPKDRTVEEEDANVMPRETVFVKEEYRNAEVKEEAVRNEEDTNVAVKKEEEMDLMEDQEPSAREALVAMNTVCRWFEKRAECGPQDLLHLHRLRAVAREEIVQSKLEATNVDNVNTKYECKDEIS